MQSVSARTETDCVLGGRRVEKMNRRAFLEQVGPVLSCGGSVGRIRGGSRKSGPSE